MKKSFIIVFSIIVMSLIGTEVFSQRGRAMRPGPNPEAYPNMRFNARQAGPMRQMMCMQPAGQRGPLQNCLDIEGLSQEQKEMIRNLHTARMEKSLQHRAQMDELRARQRSAMIMKEPDMEKINQVIDEMGALRTAWMKESVAHREEIRQILTEEQRVNFDRRSANRPMMRGRR